MKTWAWLRMWDTGGCYPIPSSEASYNAHLGQINVAMPCNGGRLMADSSWFQETYLIDGDWPQSLPDIASGAGHLYIPMVNNHNPGILTVLDSPALQQTAAENLVTLALSGRFDSPWDGVCLNLEGIPDAYREQLSDFLYLLSYHLRKNDLLCVVAVRGVTGDTGPDYDGCYSHDYRVLAQVADYTAMFCYGYFAPMDILMDRSISPYWWTKACVEFALAQGIPSQRIVLGVALFCNYYPQSGSTSGRAEITHAQAMSLMDSADASPSWVERNQFGLVRERITDLGPGHIWIHDGDTLQHSLDLANAYDLDGVSLFIPGMEDAYTWEVL